MNFVMHDTDRYGHLCMDGQPLSPEVVAARCGSTPEDYSALLAELDRHHVPARTRNGIIFSRLMVADERKRQLCAAAGRRGGGNPTFKGRLKGDLLTPSDNDNETLSVGKRRPASLNEVVERGRTLSVSASECERFFNYHESRGWVVGKSPMRDWVAALRTWKSNQRKWDREKSGEPPRKVFTPEQLRAMQEADA